MATEAYLHEAVGQRKPSVISSACTKELSESEERPHVLQPGLTIGSTVLKGVFMSVCPARC